MDASDVLELCQKLEKKGSARQANLRLIERAYKGDLEDRKRRGFWSRFFGDALPLYYDDEKAQKLRIVVNLLRPMVEAKRGLIGKAPTNRVPPSGIDAGAYALAEANEARIAAMYRWSQYKLHFANMGWFLPIHGDCVGYCDLDLENERPMLGVRSSRNFYATAADITCTALREAVFVNTYDGRHAAAMFDAKWLDQYDDVKVYEFWNKDIHAYVTDKDSSRFILRNENKFHPHVPLRVLPNIAIPGSINGDGDVEEGMELVKEFNRRYSIETEAIIRTLFAPWVVKNPLKVPKEISLDPYSVIPVGEGGDVKPAQPAQIPWQWMKGKDELRSLINYTTGTPSALTSEMDSATVTAKAFNASLGPWNAQLDVKNQYIYPGWEFLTMLGLKAMCEFWPDKSYKTFYHTQDGSPHALEFLGGEIDGYYENEVYIPGSSFVDAQTDFMQIQASRTDKRMSRRTAMRLDPRIPDVEKELAMIDEEDAKDATKMAQLNAIAQGGGGPPGMPSGAPSGSALPPAATGQDPLAASSGGMPPAGSPAAPTGGASDPSAGAPPIDPAVPQSPEELMDPMTGGGAATSMAPTPGSLSSVARVVVDEFRDVDIPAGDTVMLMGPVLQGSLGPQACEVYLSEMNNKATIVNHMTKSLPEVVGEGKDGIAFFRGTPPEGSIYIDVSPGTKGYELVGGDPGTPFEAGAAGPMAEPGAAMAGLPPEMAGMMGSMMGGGTPPAGGM